MPDETYSAHIPAAIECFTYGVNQAGGPDCLHVWRLADETSLRHEQVANADGIWMVMLGTYGRIGLPHLMLQYVCLPTRAQRRQMGTSILLSPKASFHIAYMAISTMIGMQH
jgi:hypothetical protein